MSKAVSDKIEHYMLVMHMYIIVVAKRIPSGLVAPHSTLFHDRRKEMGTLHKKYFQIW